MLKIGLPSHSDTHPTHVFISRKSPQNKPLPWAFNLPRLPPSPALPFLSILEAPYSHLCCACCGNKIASPSHPNPHPRLWLQKLELSSGLLPSVCASLWLPESSLVLLQVLYLKPLKRTSLWPPLQSLWPWRRGTPCTLSLCPQMCSVGLWVEPAYQRGNTQASPPPLSQCFRGEEGGILTQQAILHLVCSSCLAL